MGPGLAQAVCPLARLLGGREQEARSISSQCARKNHQTAPPMAAKAITPRINRNIKWAAFRANSKATMPTTAMMAIELWDKRPAFICSIMSILVFVPVYIHAFAEPTQVEAVLAVR